MNGKKMKNLQGKKTGFTLTEVLVAVVLTLILLGLMIRAFAISGSQIAKGRALLELAGQLRSTAELLRRDLNGVTANLLPRNNSGGATGYFEYIEGISNDSFLHTFENGNNDTSMLYGDVDDILMFTSRSVDQPFRGRWGGQIIESNYAEIVWWTVFEDDNGDGQFDVGEELKLYRRVLLIRPDLTTAAVDLPEFLQFNDVSVRQQPDGSIIANTLSDLSDRANRFGRSGTPFPHEPNYAVFQGTNAFTLTNPTANGTANLNSGEDVMLSGLVSFDVRAFDPVVEIRQSPDFRVGLSPSDIGYAAGDISNLQYGGYVDLFINAGNGIFTAAPGLPAPDNANILWTNATYCTWSRVYETDGYNQDDDLNSDNVVDANDQNDPAFIDEGVNGFDDNNSEGADDVTELETRPPYPYPLRGIQVTIRLVEPSTQVVRQTSVIHNFVPE